ncbi:pyridoxamine 5'-phosphate oxidase family protein [Micromonospora sp. NPDC049051]|uniref:pyridoxamine 5'-phosphate oxidase family protein n=1 Tax=unclassified Micromonospora TaxID=2617518 RepID=UPI00371E262A
MSAIENTVDALEVLAQGDPKLLHTELAQRLLHSAIPARMAYTSTDGSPRVIPVWFHWTGEEIVTAAKIAGPGVRRPARRIAALRANPHVAITIDTEEFPPEILLIRGLATVDEVAGVVDEYVLATQRYVDAEVASAILGFVGGAGTRMARIAVRPTWVGLLDFQTRLPSAQVAATE